MHERHTSALVGLGDDLVAEDIAGVGGIELLDVRAAEPAGKHAHELARPLGLGHVRERRLSVLPDDHGAHGRIVGREERSRMAVKLHRCPLLWAKASRHPCWSVQKALDDMGVEYEIVKEPWPLRGRRKDLIAAHGPERAARDRARGRLVVPRAIGRHGARDPGGALRLGHLSGATLPPLAGL